MPRRQFQYDPDIGYTYIPNLKIRIQHEAGGYIYKTNNLGFRSNNRFEKEINKDSYKKRILIFGDSYTAGDGVSNEERYSDLAQKELNGFEIYNFAIPGTGTDQQYLTWKKFAKNIKCDLIILGLQVENIKRITASYRRCFDFNGNIVLVPKPYFKLKENSLHLFNNPVPKEYFPYKKNDQNLFNFFENYSPIEKLKELIKKIIGVNNKDLIQKILRYQPLKEYNDFSNSSWLLMEAIIKQWCSEVNVPVLIFLIPTYHYIEKISSPSIYLKRFEKLHKQSESYILDPLKDFHKFPFNELRNFRFKKDDHPTPLAHKVLANSLTRMIKEMELENLL